MDQDPDDGALLARCAEGSDAALTELFERHRRPVYAQAYAEAGVRADAEEVLQDAFVLLWEKRRRVRLVGGSVLPWLLVTARNLARNQRRYQARRRGAPLLDEPGDSRGDPAHELAQRELALALDAALDRLAPIDRAIVHSCLIDGLSYREAAECLGVTHGTVRNRLGRARLTVQRHLEHAGEGGGS